MSFVKSEILGHLADSYPSLLRKDLEKVVNLVFDEIIESLAKGNGAEIRNFGSFKLRKLKSRISRNPKDGSRVDVPEKNTVKWKMSQELFQKLNQDIDRDK